MASLGEAPETSTDTHPIEERIRRRAHELWLDRGDRPGSAIEDWLKAEQELQLELLNQEQEQQTPEAARAATHGQ